MDPRRKEIVIDDWSKGADSQNELMEEGFCKRLKYFDCSNKGRLCRARPPYVVSDDWDLDDASFTSIKRFCFWYCNGTNYLVILGDVDTNDPMISMADIDDVVAGGTVTWTEFKASDGYFENDGTLDDVRFVSCTANRRSVLRVYPVYDNDDDPEEWRPLRIFNLTQSDDSYALQLTQQDNDASNRWEVIVVSPNKVYCRCSSSLDASADNTPYPCQSAGAAVEDGPNASNCQYEDIVTDPDEFITTFNDLSVGDKLLVEHYGAFESGATFSLVHSYAVEVQSIESDTEMTVSPNVYTPSQAQAEVEGHFMTVYKLGAEASQTKEANLACVRGLPLLTSGSMLEISIEGGGFEQSDHMIPSAAFDCNYSKADIVKYGFTFKTFDGQLSNIMERTVIAGPHYDHDDNSESTETDGNVFFKIMIDPDIFDDPDTSVDNATRDMARSIESLIIWRKVEGGEWQYLDEAKRVISDDDEDKFFDESDVAKIYIPGVGDYYYLGVLPISVTNKFVTVGFIDYGQTLLETIYSFTGGLSYEDLGVEVVCKDAFFFAGRMFCSNYSLINRGDSSWEDDDWVDDGIVYSLIDKYDSFPGNNYLDVARGESDHIVAFRVHGRQAFVFKEESAYIIDIVGDTIGSWKMVKKVEGVESRYHICDTPYGMCWMNENGIYAWVKNQRVMVSERFEDDFKDKWDSDSDDMVIGYDSFYDKLHVNSPANNFSWIINLKSSSMQDMDTAIYKFATFTRDLTGRLLGLRANTNAIIQYAEGKDSEVIDVNDEISPDAGYADYKSGKLDVVNLIGNVRIYQVAFYVRYSIADTATSRAITCSVRFDDDSWNQLFHSASAGDHDGTVERIVMDEWDQGRMLQVRVQPSGDFAKFELLKVVVSARKTDN